MIEDRIFRGGHHAAQLQSPELYRSRRRRLQALLGADDVAVLLGATDDRGSGDLGTFRQDPSFFYFTGVELAGAAVLLDAEHEALFLPARQPAIEQWTGPRFGPGEEAARVFGFEEVAPRVASEVVVRARRRPVPGFDERVAAALADGGALWVMLPPAELRAALTPEQELARALSFRVPSFALRDLTPAVTSLRLRKEAGEIELLRRAVDGTVAGIRAAAGAMAPGVGEGAVEGAAFAAVRASGAEGWSFPPIVGSGPAGCILHYDANVGTLAGGELVVVDIGARYGYYCGDLTRTFPVAGRFSGRQRELYEAVLRAYDAAVAVLGPGRRIAEARDAAFDALQETGLRGDGGRPLGEFFIHGLGHFLGLEAHDSGGEAPSLEPGMVVTVEPGVYLPQEGVGIRIEDDYLITPSGAENLSAELPRDVEAVEAMVGGGG